MTEKQLVSKHYAGKRNRVTVETGDKTLVEQHHRETTNINNIIGRYRQSGQLPPNTRQPQYADVSNVGELLDVHQRMIDAQEMYDQLPESIKEKLPFADIGNVSNESLSEMLDELQNTTGQHQEEAKQAEVESNTSAEIAEKAPESPGADKAKNDG